ncbi:GNAT family N-acetyltransferase [Kribbella albertanoniae]|uniref:GNAT family N-acetyltransferase n=1 Tax=Kribbella albertanoniae TaxID=1266829 RepID=A0A4R4QES7_9ACTN|nr:GNAT family N-acetyltransferase [Kribbella albertanoniae]TDC34018.1 GNAT family N-acetyltransferase [Kribbella albertanoniae]
MIEVRAIAPGDERAVAQFLDLAGSGTTVVVHGITFDATTLPGLIVERNGEIDGLLTYGIQGDDFEVVTLQAAERRTGVGAALLAAATEIARKAAERRLWLVTTNDNVDALRFYQRRGLRMVAVAAGAVDQSRKVKPTIPEVGDYGIPAA